MNAITIFIIPPDTLAFIPLTVFYITFSIFELATAVLLSVFPRALIYPSIRPLQRPFSFFFVFVIVTNVLAAIRPCEFPTAMHLIIFPGSFIASLVSPSIFTVSTDIVELELAFVARAVSPSELPCAVLCSINKVTFIFRLVWPGFSSLSVLFIFEPVASIDCTIKMSVNADTMGFIVFPLSLVNISV